MKTNSLHNRQLIKIGAIRTCRLMAQLLTTLLMAVFLTGCATNSNTSRVAIDHNGHSIVGDLSLPDNDGPHPLVILIHGDGPVPANNFGYYKPLIDEFLQAGFATLSWDKPGVGRSKGDWLSQSVQDRADELLVFTKMIKQRDDIEADHVGLWGISQAGWVMPLAVAQSSEYAFMISVSGAINWQRQGRYLTRNRMQQEGYSEQDIKDALVQGEKANALLASDLTYEQFMARMADAPSYGSPELKEDRWRFVRLNIDADASAPLQEVDIPVLAIFGDKDANVDTNESARVYKEALAFAKNKDVTIKVYENADHALFPSKKPRRSGSGMADLWRTIKVEFIGADAFAPGYISDTVQWVVDRYKNQ